MKFFLLLIFFFQIFGQFHKHPIYTSVVSHTLCCTIFISNRTFSPLKPYLEELSDEPGHFVNIKVDYQKKTVKATSIQYPHVERTSKFIDIFRGCTVLMNNNEIPPLKENDQTKRVILQKKVNDSIQKIIEKQFQNLNISTRAIIVYHKDKIIGEMYAKEFTVNTSQKGWSLTKSLLNILYGILDYENKMNLNDKIAAPEWRNITDDPRNRLTIEHLFRMASGLNFTEQYGWESDPAKMLYNSTSSANFASLKTMIKPPLSRFYYATSDSIILSRKLRDYFKTKEDYWRFPREKLFDKLGMSKTAIINVDPSLDFVGGAFGYLIPRDWLKLGILYLNGGIFNGERIVSPEWVKKSTTPTPESNGRYGLHWWTPKISGIPPIFMAEGFRRQKILVCPSLNLVILRMGCTFGRWDEFGFFREIVREIEQNN